ncbi:hypothetical protein INR49_007282 [Caranx melampygus]|nr:hypothetical protein INR49_007282 [Caranx melampygus]
MVHDGLISRTHVIMLSRRFNVSAFIEQLRQGRCQETGPALSHHVMCFLRLNSGSQQSNGGDNA